MIAKHKVIASIIEVGVIAIIRTNTAEQAEKSIHACLEGGLKTIEIPFTVPHAQKVIEQVKEQKQLCILGAGTVLDAQTARIAILAGASYIVSPSFDVDTALLCNRYAVPYLPGCSTATQMLFAMEHGVDIIKLFPGTTFTPKIISVFKAPLPQLNLMPTGGISLDNAAEWIQHGAVAVGVGSEITRAAMADDYKLVKTKAAAYVQAVREARSKA